MCFASSCGTVNIYEEQGKPIFHVNTINADAVKHADCLKVVSFNIEKSEKIEEAVTELQDFDKPIPSGRINGAGMPPQVRLTSTIKKYWCTAFIRKPL